MYTCKTGDCEQRGEKYLVEKLHNEYTEIKRLRTFNFLLSATVIIESGCTFCVPYFFYLYLIAARYQRDVIIDLTFDSTTISALDETIVRRSWKIRAFIVVGLKKNETDE